MKQSASTADPSMYHAFTSSRVTSNELLFSRSSSPSSSTSAAAAAAAADVDADTRQSLTDRSAEAVASRPPSRDQQQSLTYLVCGCSSRHALRLQIPPLATLLLLPPPPSPPPPPPRPSPPSLLASPAPRVPAVPPAEESMSMWSAASVKDPSMHVTASTSTGSCSSCSSCACPGGGGVGIQASPSGGARQRSSADDAGGFPGGFPGGFGFPSPASDDDDVGDESGCSPFCCSFCSHPPQSKARTVLSAPPEAASQGSDGWKRAQSAFVRPCAEGTVAATSRQNLPSPEVAQGGGRGADAAAAAAAAEAAVAVAVAAVASASAAGPSPPASSRAVSSSTRVLSSATWLARRLFSRLRSSFSPRRTSLSSWRCCCCCAASISGTHEFKGFAFELLGFKGGGSKVVRR